MQNNIAVAIAMSKIVTIMADGNSGILGVVDGEDDEVTVGVEVGVGVLPTLKVALAVANVAPLLASTAPTEIV